MKRSLFILILLVFLAPVSFTEAHTAEYPKYHGTKRCELVAESVVRDYPSYYDGASPSYYVEGGNLYWKGELYREGVDVVYAEYAGKVLYGVFRNRNTAIDAYENHTKIVSADSIDPHESYFDPHYGSYILNAELKSRQYYVLNGKFFPATDFVRHYRYYSDDGKSHVEERRIGDRFEIEQNGKITLSRVNAHVYNITVSNDGKKFSALVQDIVPGSSRLFVMNSRVTDITHVEGYQYSPSGKDLYYATSEIIGPEGGADSTRYISEITFYRNGRKLGNIRWVFYGDITFDFMNETHFRTILTDWNDYALVENGKIVVSYTDPIQTKLIRKDPNGDEFRVTRNKTTSKDTLEVNGQKVVEAKSVDERYLNGGAGTFSLYANRQPAAGEYYTYITEDDGNYYLLVDGFRIPDFYDYLNMEARLDSFRFAGNHGQVFCQDISYRQPGITQHSRKALEVLIRRAQSYQGAEREALKARFEKALSENRSAISREILRMLLDNME